MPSGASQGEREKTGPSGSRLKPIIVISGSPGSGKSTYARRLAEDLKLRYFNTGEIFRGIAKEKGLSLVDLSRLAERDPSIDLEIDRKTLESIAEGGVVIDSHLAGWVLSGIADFSVYLKAPTDIRLLRISEREGKQLNEVIVETLERELSQWIRFRNYYGFDLADLSHFDLVIDTSVLSIDEIYEIIRRTALFVLKRKGFNLTS